MKYTYTLPSLFPIALLWQKPFEKEALSRKNRLIDRCFYRPTRIVN